MKEAIKQISLITLLLPLTINTGSPLGELFYFVLLEEEEQWMRENGSRNR